MRVCIAVSSGGGETSCFVGPSVACVGWIPFYRDLSGLPECEFKTHRFARPGQFSPSAFSVLFGLGNPAEPNAANNPSPASFTGRSQFLELLGSKNYRASLALDDVRLWYNHQKTPTHLSFKLLGEVGYTPYRIELNSRLITIHSRGRGSACYRVVEGKTSVTIEHWIRFKIGAVGDLGCFVMTSNLAPSALMKVEYTMQFDGSVGISFAGTGLPSQSYFVNWTRQGIHDMMEVSTFALDQFLEAGGCRDAPATDRASWTGSAVEAE